MQYVILLLKRNFVQIFGLYNRYFKLRCRSVINVTINPCLRNGAFQKYPVKVSFSYLN